MVDTMATHMLDTMDMQAGDARREKLRPNLKLNPDTCMGTDMAMVSMVEAMVDMVDMDLVTIGDARREKLRPNLKLNLDTCMGTDMAMVSMVDTMVDMVDMDLVTIGESNSLPSCLRCHQSA